MDLKNPFSTQKEGLIHCLVKRAEPSWSQLVSWRKPEEVSGKKMHMDKVLTLRILDLVFILWPFKKHFFCLIVFVFTALGRYLSDVLTSGQALLSCLMALLLCYSWVHIAQLVDLSPPSPTTSHPSSFLSCITSDSSQMLLTPGGHPALAPSLTRTGHQWGDLLHNISSTSGV